MATSIKQTSILLVEFVDSSGNAVLNWRLDYPQNNLTRAQVVTATNAAFANSNTCGFDILRNSSMETATALGKVQTVETNVTTTDLV